MEDRKKLAEMAEQSKPNEGWGFLFEQDEEYIETEKADWIKWWNKQGGDPDKAEAAYENRINTARKRIPVPADR